jgi:hypothetical protein
LYAINATVYSPLRIGDEASAFGFIYDHGIYISRYWKGTLAGKLGNHYYHAFSNTSFLAEEYLFQGVAELDGMSGGPTANGHGYTGIVHGNNFYTTSKVSMACVVPFSIILSGCIQPLLNNSSFYQQLMGPKQCPNVKVLQIPEF